MKRILLLVIIIAGYGYAGFSQSDIDAFRFSQYNYEGTARFMGTAGSFGAVGAEFSALSTNPASIGIYKKHEVSFTPLVVSVMKNNISYNGNTTNFQTPHYSLSNAGIVMVANLKEPSKWRAIQFGYGYNRLCDFNNTMSIKGISNNSSMMNQFVDNANGINYYNLSGDCLLAWNTWMLDTLNSNHYYSPFQNATLSQEKYVKTSGAIDEMVFSFGGNYEDKLFVGATIGVPFINYREESSYKEYDDENNVGGIYSYSINDILRVNSTGINLKLGILYQPADFIRFGAAFHTPTYYGNMKDNFYREMISFYDNGDDSSPYFYENDFNYSLVTPLRAMANVAFFIRKRGFISAEYEMANYGSSQMYADSYFFSEENENIYNKYGYCHIARAGGEFYLSSNILARFGYQFKSSPYKDNINNATMHTGAIGLGIRTKSIFIDFAYQINLSNYDYWLYDPNYVNPANNYSQSHKIVATIGCKF